MGERGEREEVAPTPDGGDHGGEEAPTLVAPAAALSARARSDTVRVRMTGTGFPADLDRGLRGLPSGAAPAAPPVTGPPADVADATGRASDERAVRVGNEAFGRGVAVGNVQRETSEPKDDTGYARGREPASAPR